MRTPVHPDDAIGAAESSGNGVRDELLCHRVENSENTQGRPWASHQVLHGMRLGLALGLRKNRGVPGFGFLTGGFVDRQPHVVAELWPGGPMRLIFIADDGPVP